jgi:tRNA pseudouridine38-40 synthase
MTNLLSASVGSDPQRKRNLKLVLEYDGANYHGWQRQAGMLTVQEVLESRLEIMLGQSVRVRGSGRTDAGVHARGQVVNFYARSRLGSDQILRGLNSLLPPDIVVLHATDVPDSFHARFSAVSKVYEYHILNRPTGSALERNRAWHIRRPLDVAAMQEALADLLGQHDFRAFMAAGSSVRSTERCLYEAELQRRDSERIVFRFVADGFLRHMVRNLVGTLVEVGRGRITPAGLREILAGLDRRRAGMTAPAHGLYLVTVNYGEDWDSPVEKKGEG